MTLITTAPLIAADGETRLATAPFSIEAEQQREETRPILNEGPYELDGFRSALPISCGAHWAVMELIEHADAHRIEVAGERMAQCARRLRRVALTLDRVLGERGDEEGRRRLVDAALRLTANV